MEPMTKERTIRQCLQCDSRYTKPFVSPEEGPSYAKCPYCLSREREGMDMQYRIIGAEVFTRNRTWWNPFGWGTGRWIPKLAPAVRSEVEELERIYHLKG